MIAGVSLFLNRQIQLFPIDFETRACIALLCRRIIHIAGGMTTESILERINRKPFQPIALQTVDGVWIDVYRADDIFIYDRMKTSCVVVFDSEGKKLILQPDEISAIQAR